MISSGNRRSCRTHQRGRTIQSNRINKRYGAQKNEAIPEEYKKKYDSFLNILNTERGKKAYEEVFGDNKDETDDEAAESLESSDEKEKEVEG